MISLSKRNHRKIFIYYNNSQNLLSELSTKYNSDKGSLELIKVNNSYGYESHTYTDFYSMLFDTSRDKFKLVFECGILSGASLRMWRDYFINSHIFGGDFDKQLLFQEDRISTFYMDQLKRDTIKNMWLKINNNNFDLIIDDGLHSNEANTNLFEESFEYLKSGGIYIIEDVANEDLIFLSKYLHSYKPETIVLKSKGTRYSNNNLIIIRKNI